MIGFATETIGTALALWVTTLVYSDINFGKHPEVWWIIVVAVVIGLANAVVKPALKILTFPISLMTLGLSALIVNAAVLLGVAFIAEKLKITFIIGHFPHTIDTTTIAAALIGAVILSVVSLLIGLIPFVKTSR